MINKYNGGTNPRTGLINDKGYDSISSIGDELPRKDDLFQINHKHYIIK